MNRKSIGEKAIKHLLVMKKQARTEKDSGEKQEEERAAHKGRQEKGTSDE